MATATAPDPVTTKAADTDPADVTETFEVLHRLVLLEDRRATNPLAQNVFGDVARVPGKGHLVARWEAGTIAGPTRFGYRPWSDDPRLPPAAADWSRVPHDAVERIRAKLEELRSGVGLHRIEPSPAEAELARFAKDWPHVAEALCLVKRRPAVLFELGPCVYMIKFDRDRHLAGVEWEHYRDRHAAGDFGLNGQLDHAALEDPVTAWMIGTAPVNLQNTHAIANRAGLVKSRYPLPADVAARLRKPYLGEAGDYEVNVVTALDPRRGEPTTLLCVQPAVQPL